jgi:Na+-translocating ferredoxin:NAD+ oxidoreductase subunit A
MRELITLAFTMIFINNILLSQFLGICSFIGVSKKRSSAIGMSLSVIVVIFLAGTISWLLYNLVLVPLEIPYLSLLTFILVIASIVQLLEMVLKKFIPSLYKALGIYLPLITTNCAILGVAVTGNIKAGYDFVNMIVYSLAIGVGYLLVMFIFSAIREKIDNLPIPAPFKGAPIALVIAGFMALAFSGLLGVL